MSDMEKVIMALELHREGMCQDTNKQLCPYWECNDDCYKQMADDILSLLKSQQAEIKRLKEEHPVRCKDCIKRGSEVDCPICATSGRLIYAEWFCADGERTAVE